LAKFVIAKSGCYRHSFGVYFLTLAKQLRFFFLSSNGSYVELRIGKMNATYVMYIAKLRNGSKRVKNVSKQFRERVKMERERESTHTKRIEVEMFLLSKDIHPFIMRDFWSSFLSLPFFNTFSFFLFLSLFFSALSLYFGILKIFEEKTNFKFFFGWDGSGYTMNMKMGELQVY
jgi:hypothetical protein